MPTSRLWSFVLGVGCGVALVLGALTTLAVRRYHILHPGLPPALAARDMDLAAFDPEHDTIIHGSPNYRGAILGLSHDGRAHSGLFACDGPSKFVWKHEHDEHIYIIDGEVTIEHDGGRFTLEVGDSAFLPAGTVATWNVDKYVRKAYFLQRLGPVARLMRRLDPWEIDVPAAAQD